MNLEMNSETRWAGGKWVWMLTVSATSQFVVQTLWGRLLLQHECFLLRSDKTCIQHSALIRPLSVFFKRLILVCDRRLAGLTSLYCLPSSLLVWSDYSRSSFVPLISPYPLLILSIFGLPFFFSCSELLLVSRHRWQTSWHTSRFLCRPFFCSFLCLCFPKPRSQSPPSFLLHLSSFAEERMFSSRPHVVWDREDKGHLSERRGVCVWSRTRSGCLGDEWTLKTQEDKAGGGASWIQLGMCWAFSSPKLSFWSLLCCDCEKKSVICWISSNKFGRYAY